ncbi:5353_t:CDS:10 [Diversispora eburnea]|uniref:Hydroxysteroid dehydrogenase-like protein 2 n=1 Tax=Diversispora eburnea TaxID=1213867 RepID=A0A9N8UYI2_9GLOM|nr:5353_t:CDS:10 [Diversispora eburnea]
MTLKNKVLVISGASRGIGLAIALRAAKDGGCIAVLAKTDTPNPKLPGTIYTAAQEIERIGGKEAVKNAIQKVVNTFGGIDIVVNNASAISPTDTQETTFKKYTLMHEINSRGTWLVTKYAIPYLIESGKKNRNPHILNISPPLDFQKHWFSNHVAYSIAKYNMSLLIFGWDGEFKEYALWPLTVISTAALQVLEIMADAAYLILNKNSKEFSGNFVIDEVILRENGQTKFDHYSVIPGNIDLQADLFVDEKLCDKMRALWKESSHKKDSKL